MKQKLFFFHEVSPGSCFFTPEGFYIYNKLKELIRFEQRKRNYQEVISPNIFKTELWKKSGHWQHYSEDMFLFQSNENSLALKPMNCPGHCLIFRNDIKTWSDLPVRLSEFGVLHRNESRGTLSGLTRVRRFQQDDAHIFCRFDQIKSEIHNLLDYLKNIYKILGFQYNLSFSTRPDDYMGELHLWNHAEEVLSDTLEETGIKWNLNPKDGAFYGPKIDITIKDHLNRLHQCATIQLDFQLPINFDLKYVCENGSINRPVIIHCAILGSFERMIGILAESYKGKWPFWLSPRQVSLVPLHAENKSYALNVCQQLHDINVKADVVFEKNFRAAIKKSHKECYNFILVVGKKDEENMTANVRVSSKVVGEFKVDEIKRKLKYLDDNKCLKWERDFKTC